MQEIGGTQVISSYWIWTALHFTPFSICFFSFCTPNIK